MTLYVFCHFPLPYSVEQVDNFVYLGSIQSSDDGSQLDIKRRIVLASSVMSSLQPIWSDRYLSLPTKVPVYQTLVLPVLTYACETWTLSAADTRRLEAFRMKYQRQIAHSQHYKTVNKVLARFHAAKLHSADVERLNSCSNILKSPDRSRMHLDTENTNCLFTTTCLLCPCGTQSLLFCIG